jgi:hypothetical protein
MRVREERDGHGRWAVGIIAENGVSKEGREAKSSAHGPHRAAKGKESDVEEAIELILQTKENLRFDTVKEPANSRE